MHLVVENSCLGTLFFTLLMSRKSSKFAQKFNDNFLITGLIVKAD